MAMHQFDFEIFHLYFENFDQLAVLHGTSGDHESVQSINWESANIYGHILHILQVGKMEPVRRYFQPVFWELDSDIS